MKKVDIVDRPASTLSAAPIRDTRAFPMADERFPAR